LIIAVIPSQIKPFKTNEGVESKLHQVIFQFYRKHLFTHTNGKLQPNRCVLYCTSNLFSFLTEIQNALLLPWIRVSLFRPHISIHLFLGRPMDLRPLGCCLFICSRTLSYDICSMCDSQLSLQIITFCFINFLDILVLYIL
jgi:hypothetical protein